MKTRIRRHDDGRTRQAGKPDLRGQADRDGSVIVVVLALLIGLLFLGILLFKDSSQEEINAEYFADSAKVRESQLDPESLFHNALRQIILGANSNEKHSPFYGGRMSLLPTMFGKDRTMFNGEGVRIVYDSTTGAYYTDQNYDNNSDQSAGTPISWLYLNHSVAAAGMDMTASELANMPDPDVPWTYPDHHSIFLSYDGQAPLAIGSDIDPNTMRRCIIPSYLRPQHLRNLAAPNQWYTSSTTARLVVRPHREHYAVLKDGTIARDAANNPIRRFVSSTYPDTTANALVAFPLLGDGTTQTNLTGNFGIWNSAATPYGDFDEDLDGDGIKESVYLDMDLGIYTTPDGTRKFVPIVSAKLVSLDALLNLNAHGNVARTLQSDGTPRPLPFMNNPTAYLHRSNQGVSRSEVNPLYGLLAAFPGAMNPDLEQHRIYWSGDPAGSPQLANMEYWWLKMGRPQYQGSRTNILSLYPGPYGEVSRMKQAATNLSNPPQSFPMPGTTQVDDNGNGRLGGVYSDPTNAVFPNFIQFSAFGHPNDYRSTGEYVNGVTQRRTMNVQRHVFPSYDSYLYYQSLWPTSLYSNSVNNVLLFDEMSELRLDQPSPDDSPYTSGETVSLHMSASDRSAVGRDGDRILQNAPYNFVNGPLADITRRLFTTESWDSPTFGKVFYRYGTTAQFRNWEFSNTSGTTYEFPTILATDPLRPELRQLLGHRRWDTTGAIPLMRRLSVNGIADRYPDAATSNVRFRPLTPHPTGLPAEPVSGVNSVVASRFTLKSPEQIGNNGGTDADKQRQEWLARYDRQRMARDIYTLLYLYGGGGDRDYTTTNSANQHYSAKQMQDMAQFAVNLVDALDADDVITVFEYDTDLSNGWSLDDDPYTDGTEAGATDIMTERGVVYGVEAQTLAFSEAMAILTKRTNDAATSMVPTNHPGTDYDDSRNHLFSYIELQNASPRSVPISGNWQIVIKDPRNPSTITGTTPFVAERRLTLLSDTVNPPTSAADLSRFTIGTQDDKDYTLAPMSTNIKPSHFLVNPKYGDADDPGGFVRCAPRLGLSLDLMTSGNAFRYRLSHKPTSGHTVSGTYVEEGPTITGAPPTDPAGKDLLKIVTGDPADPAMQTVATPATLDSGAVDTMGVRVQLRRRQHLNRQTPVTVEANAGNHVQQSVDNPWIVVDEMTIPLKTFLLQKDDTKTTELRTALQKIVSRERRQPLVANDPTFGGDTQEYPNSTVNPSAVPPPPGNEYILNSLGDVNARTAGLPGARFTLWQPHFDRDFASVSELFGIPLYGPDQLTSALGTQTASSKINLANTATSYFLHPEYPPTAPPAVPNGENRWYRLFELLEVPDRNPTSNPWYVDYLGRFGSPLMSRIPGKMSLNTMAHPALLAGLLDEQTLLPRPDEAGFATLRDKIDPARHWWGQFLLARDGRDVTSGGYTLPGVPGTSKPFRELNYAVEGQNSLEHTVLRSLPMDGGNAVDRRRLFELGTSSQHTSWQTDTNIDVTTRYRLLNKVLNNTTNRSNVFVLILRIDFFEAKEVDTSNGPLQADGVTREKVVRIGAKLPGAQNPGYLAYYVIDRSKAAQLVTAGDLPEKDQEGVAGRFSWRFRQDMDFSPLILHQQRIK